jgi:hypothetical protein
MILKNKAPKVEAFGELSEGKFGVSEKDQVHILSILRDKLYSDKIMAVIREYSTNAVDAHIDAGVPEKPIKITLPSLISPNYLVRDYGDGLTEDEVLNLYTKYGASTKRDSNDAIGQLGLGCKSGFAYSNNFTITSFKDGAVSIYHAFIDETNVGKISKLHEAETDEPNGVEISIAVNQKDYNVFRDKAMQCFQHFDVKPEINIELPEKTFIKRGEFWGVRDSARSNNWNVNRNLDKPVAIMGNIGYPIHIDKIPGLKKEETFLLNCPLEIKFPIGLLSISASRESLEYTDHTQKNLRRAIAQVVGEFKKKVEEEFKECKDAWTARKQYRGLASMRGAHYGYNNFISQILSQYRKWNGIDISQNSISVEKAPKEIKADSITSYNISPSRSVYGRSASLTDDTILIINDVKSAWVKKAIALRQYLSDEKDGVGVNIIAVRPSGEPDPEQTFEEAIEEFCKERGLIGITTYNLSDLPEGVKLDEKDPTVKVARKRVTGLAFKVTDPLLLNRSRPSASWEKVEVDMENDKGIYVVIDRFVPLEPMRAEFVEMMKSLQAIGVDITKLEIHGFKIKVKEKIGKGWTPFKDYFEKKLVEWVKKEKVLQLLKDQEEYNKTRRISIRNIKAIANKKNDFENAQNSLLEFCEKYVELHRKVANISDINRKKISIASSWVQRREIEIELEPSYPLSKKYLEVIEEYPLLSMTRVFDNYYQPTQKDWVDSVIHYCNKV